MTENADSGQHFWYNTIMRTLKPIKNSVVCKRINNKDEIVNNIILIPKKNVDLYQIVDFHSDDDFPFSIGDVVMSCSTGDEIEINPDEIIYLFKTEHIMCKVEP